MKNFVDISGTPLNIGDKVAGYQSDDGILEHECAISAVKKLYEQKSIEWRKEDEEYLNFVIATMKTLQVKCTENEIKNHSNSQAAPYYAKVINWLKSLRPQKQWKPSEEQMKALHDLNLTGNISYAGQGQILIDLYNSLKELT